MLHKIGWKIIYVNIMNSKSFLLSALKQMKSCIYSVVPANAGMGQ